MIIVRQAVLAAALAAAVLVPRGVHSQVRQPGRYANVLNLYQGGGIEAALRALSTLSEGEVREGRAIVLRSFEEGTSTDRKWAAASMHVAALLHTDAAFAWAGKDNDNASRDLDLARTWVEKLARSDYADTLSRDWWLLVIGFFQGRFDFVQAHALGERAQQVVGDSPILLLAIGVTHEMAWTATHERGGAYSFKGDLKKAESAYRSALARQPDLIDARVRLGRVLTLRGDVEGSLAALNAIGPGADARSRYVARLFEGDALERRGNAADAERRYLSAVAAFPQGQSARIALAHLRYTHGARSEAGREVGATTMDLETADTIDPWFRYSAGLVWYVDEYLRALRATVQR